LVSQVLFNFNIDDVRRLNVALTRAKHSLWVVTNPNTFKANNTWKSFLLHCHEHKYIRTAKNDTIQQVLLTETAIVQLSTNNLAPVTLTDCLWTVTFTKSAKNSFGILDKSIIIQLVQKILTIASGAWPKKLIESNEGRKIRSAKVGKLLILWTIELESNLTNYQQVINIWDVCDHTRAEQVASHVRHILKSRSEEYNDVCSKSDFEIGGKHVKPLIFSKSHHKIFFYKSHANRIVDENPNSDNIDLTNLVKTYNMSQEIISLMHQDTFKKLELPFKLGEDEEALVANPRSIFILGRSGTGKTTVMLSRMIHKELISVGSDIEQFTGSKGSQWLVTCNKLLRNVSNSYYDKVKLSYPQLSNHKSPDFLTFHDVLFNIDGTLKTPYFSKKISNFIYNDLAEISGGSFATVGNFSKENEVTLFCISYIYGNSGIYFEC
jgi:hypothetical protein